MVCKNDEYKFLKKKSSKNYGLVHLDITQLWL
jgi:hypothetical protein